MKTISAMRSGGLRALAAATVLALGLALTGCGAEEADSGVPSAGGETSDGGAAPEDAATDNREQVLEFTKCLREHGMDIDDPAPGEGFQLRVGPGDEEAMNACRDLAPEGGQMGGGNPEMAAAMADYAECMRENGVEAFPDPDPANPGRMMITPEVGEDPDFEGAQQTCADVLPDGGDRMGGPA